MFLPEIPKAAAEIGRVLKPGGWLASAVWAAPDKNPALRMPIEVIKQFIELPPPDPTAPGIFRLATPGDLAGMLQQAGFADMMDQEFLAEWAYPSAQEYVQSLLDIAAPIQNLMATLTPPQQREAEQKIVAAAEAYRRDTAIVFPIAVRVVAARKPL
jgi:SAM-dependent methyltransferase